MRQRRPPTGTLGSRMCACLRHTALRAGQPPATAGVQRTPHKRPQATHQQASKLPTSARPVASAHVPPRPLIVRAVPRCSGLASTDGWMPSYMRLRWRTRARLAVHHLTMRHARSTWRAPHAWARPVWLIPRDADHHGAGQLMKSLDAAARRRAFRRQVPICDPSHSSAFAPFEAGFET